MRTESTTHFPYSYPWFYVNNFHITFAMHYGTPTLLFVCMNVEHWKPPGKLKRVPHIHLTPCIAHKLNVFHISMGSPSSGDINSIYNVINTEPATVFELSSWCAFNQACGRISFPFLRKSSIATNITYTKKEEKSFLSECVFLFGNFLFVFIQCVAFK